LYVAKTVSCRVSEITSTKLFFFLVALLYRIRTETTR